MFVPLTPLQFYRRAAGLFGRKVGVVDGARRFTYREFGERVERLGGALRRLDLAPGARVSFITFNTHHLLEAYYGVPLAGGVLNPINIRLAPQEIAYIVNHAGSRVLFFHHEFVPLVRQLRQQLPAVEHYVVVEGGPEVAGFAAHEYEALLADAQPLSVDLTTIDENSPAELFYTSGTTAQPKGVVLTHRTLYLHTLNALVALGVREEDVYLHIVPLYHGNGWGSPQTITAVGARHVILRKFDPVQLFSLIQQERVTGCMGAPVIFNALVNHPEVDKYDTSSLRFVISGAAPVPKATIKAVEEKLGGRCIQGYGLTETAPVLTLANPKSYLVRSEDDRLELQAKTGFSVIGVELRVVDDQGRDVPPDGETMGEIVVRSNVVMDAYFRDSLATAEAIRDGWFYTGDMAVIDEEGYVLIKDRRKDIIISGGLNISSAEVEDVLYSHPAIYQCAVIGVPHERWGEVPKALVVLKPAAQAGEQEIIDYCRERLAHYKAPASVDFLESLPISGTGKVLKRELRERYWAGYEKRVH